MKKIYTVIITLAFSLQTLVAWAGNPAEIEQNSSSSATTYYINAPRFVRPLIEKWISEYKKVHPEVNFAIAKTPATKNASILNIQLSGVNDKKDADSKVAYFGSYAILPITSKNSEAANSLENQQLNAKKLKALFFENEEIDELDGKKNKFSNLVVYSGNGNESISHEFASFFGKDATNFRGKRIVGDDQFLITAIAKDPQGVTFNTLGNIYDLQSRKVKTNISIIHLDINKEIKAVLSEDSNIDNLLEALESHKDAQIPVEKIGFSYQGSNIDASQFLAWILTQGEQFNHQYGIMRLDSKLIAQQAKSLPARLTAQK